MFEKLKNMVGRIALVDFIYASYVLPKKTFDLPSYPVFKSTQASEEFYRLLQRCDFYVEYGSGGSTLAAVKLSKNFQSYESSRAFHKIMNNKMQKMIPEPAPISDFLLYEFGPIRSWSIPFPSGLNKVMFAKKMCVYSEPHWKACGEFPDLILIDGRFRVSCALKNFAALEGKKFHLVVDDYAERSEYSVIEKYGNLRKVIGTTAFFDGIKTLDGVDEDIAKYELDYR